MDPFKHIVFRARLAQDEPALATIDGVITYRALANMVAAVSEVLTTLKLDGKTLVVLDVKNRLHHTALMIALGLNGIPSASMQTEMSVRKSGILPALVLSDTKGATFAGVRLLEVTADWFVSTAGPNAVPDYVGMLATRGFGAGSDLVRVAFSSGTTGFPKAVGVRLRQLEGRLQQLNMFRVPGMERMVMMGGPSILGFYMVALHLLSHGYMICLAGSAEEIIHLTRVFRAGYVGLATGQLPGILKLLEGKPPLSSLKGVGLGGSKLALSLLREAQGKLTSNIAAGYGSTEAGALAGGSGDMLASQNSVGYLMPDVEMQAVDADHRPLPSGETGVIRVKAPYMLEYLNPTPDTAEMFRDGWFYPGDVGSIDRDGLVRIVGRTTDVINHGGAIVAPEYVEEVLRTVRGVRDVAVFGVVNSSGIEEIWAAVIGDDNLIVNAVVPAVRDRLVGIAPHRVVLVDQIPRNEMAKVKRKELRDKVLAMEGISLVVTGTG
jgi:acyl-CoA synthetase (AMP-forming)/AMP-acid ligase II